MTEQDAVHCISSNETTTTNTVSRRSHIRHVRFGQILVCEAKATVQEQELHSVCNSIEVEVKQH